jgi:hypothetical protein
MDDEDEILAHIEEKRLTQELIDVEAELAAITYHRFVADKKLTSFRIKRMETQAAKIGWVRGILVRGRMKHHDKLPKHLWKVLDRRPEFVTGVYVGCMKAPSGEIVPKVMWPGAKKQETRSPITHTEAYDWHRVLDVPKKD